MWPRAKQIWLLRKMNGALLLLFLREPSGKNNFRVDDWRNVEVILSARPSTAGLRYPNMVRWQTAAYTKAKVYHWLWNSSPKLCLQMAQKHYWKKRKDLDGIPFMYKLYTLCSKLVNCYYRFAAFEEYHFYIIPLTYNLFISLKCKCTSLV